jgi:hypothetical protein
MKNVVMLLACLSLSVITYSQDLIVTRNNDSLNCKINEITNKVVRFEYQKSGETVNSVISRKQVLAFRENFFMKTENDTSLQTKRQTHRFHVGVNGGIACRLGPVNSVIPLFYKDYYEGLRLGFTGGGDAAYFFNNHWGVGVEYNYFGTSTTSDSTTTQLYDGSTQTGFITESMRVHYFGSVLYYKLPVLYSQGSILCNASVGLTHFKEDLSVPGKKYQITSNVPGLSLGIAYETPINESLLFNIGLSMHAAYISKYKNSEGGESLGTINLESSKYINLTRIEVILGLKFIK